MTEKNRNKRIYKIYQNVVRIMFERKKKGKRQKRKRKEKGGKRDRKREIKWERKTKRREGRQNEHSKHKEPSYEGWKGEKKLWELKKMRR